MSLTTNFVDVLCDLFDGGLDDAATRSTSDLLLDGVAVAAMGASEQGPTILRSLAADAGSAPVATLIGGPGRVSMEQAAQANGAAMHVLDYEPMWNPANHSLSTTLPAVLAVAERLIRDRTAETDLAPGGADILKALAIGIEAQARLRRASGQFEPGDLVFHPPSTVGPLGSAVACGLLLRLAREEIVHAVGIAGSMAGGLQGNIGSMTKALHCGMAAAGGLQAALLASRGFTADADALDGPRGYGQAFFRETFEPQALLESHPQLHVVSPGPAFKLYPSQYGTHFVITASLEARKQMTPNCAIRRVTIVSPPMPYVDRPAPASGLAGKFSFQYVAAAALLDGTVSVESFRDARRFATDVEDLLSRIDIRVEPERQGRFDRMKIDVIVELENGAVAQGMCDGPPGIWGRPADPAALVRKARDCLDSVYGTAQGAHVLDAARRFAGFESEDVVGFMDDLAIT